MRRSPRTALGQAHQDPSGAQPSDPHHDRVCASCEDRRQVDARCASSRPVAALIQFGARVDEAPLVHLCVPSYGWWVRRRAGEESSRTVMNRDDKCGPAGRVACDERHARDGMAGPQRGKEPMRCGIHGVPATNILQHPVTTQITSSARPDPRQRLQFVRQLHVRPCFTDPSDQTPQTPRAAASLKPRTILCPARSSLRAGSRPDPRTAPSSIPVPRVPPPVRARS